MADHNQRYLIWSHEHGAWWAPNQYGYVRDITKAGRYSRIDALHICVDAMTGHPPKLPPPEIMVLESDMETVYGAHQWKIR